MLVVIALLQGFPEVRAYGFLLASFVIASCYHALCAHFVRARGDTALFAAAVFLGAGGIVALSPLLIRILADEPYYPAWRYIPMLTLSMAAAALSNFMGSVYVVTKKSAASFWTSLVGATANVLLNLWLIPWLGIQGAAATFFSCLAVFLIRLVNARLLLPFPLSGKKLALGVGALTVQTGWLLLGLPGGLLGLGWMVGMAACVILLSGLFAKNIYFMSSLFLGLTLCSVPFIVSAERETLKKQPLRHGWFLLLGVAAVVALTLLRTGMGAMGSVNYAHLTSLQVVYIFFSGMVAITAMVLPGISGSSILLIAGVYLPTIQAVHSFLRLQLDVVPGLCALGFGVVAGAELKKATKRREQANGALQKGENTT